MHLNYSNGQLIGSITGHITKFLSYETKIADFCKQINSNEPIKYFLSYDVETNKTILNIKSSDDKLLSHPTKYSIGETIPIDGTVASFFLRHRTARTSPTLRFAFMSDINMLLAINDTNTTYYIRITDIKPVRPSRITVDDACDIGVYSLNICHRKSYYIPNFNTDSITFYSTAHRAMMALAYKTLPKNAVLNNQICLMYEFELLMK
jgi:hypothetical protein